MIILGIDPGYAIVGWGVIRYERGRFIPVDFGAITTPAGMPFNRRLEILYDELTALLTRHTPDAVAVEKLYFHIGMILPNGYDFLDGFDHLARLPFPIEDIKKMEKWYLKVYHYALLKEYIVFLFFSFSPAFSEHFHT